MYFDEDQQPYAIIRLFYVSMYCFHQLRALLQHCDLH